MADQLLPGAVDEPKRLAVKRHKGIYRRDGNVLCLNCIVIT